MTKLKIFCYYCKKPINSEKDLVTSVYYVVIRPFHSKCYSERLKKLFWEGVPINGRSNNIKLITSSIIALIFIIGIAILNYSFSISWQSTLAFTSIIMAGLLLSLFIRFYSYFKYERPLIDK